MSDYELKPCPFCGELHNVEETTDFHWGKGWSIACNKRVLFSVYSEEDIPVMVSKWNNRPIEDELRRERDCARKHALDEVTLLAESQEENRRLQQQIDDLELREESQRNR